MKRTPIKRRTRPKARRAKPRRGRVRDPHYLEFIAQQPCIVTGERPVTVHHVRRFGEPKDDTRTVPLVARLHMLTHETPSRHWFDVERVETWNAPVLGIGPCVERGKEVFQAYWNVDLEAEILRLRLLYQLQHEQ